jgi:hypothetical protein
LCHRGIAPANDTDFLITETLLNPDRNRGYRYFQTQLLKLYFLTTLYVDVKEPAVLHISATKKLNLAPTIISCQKIMPGQN